MFLILYFSVALSFIGISFLFDISNGKVLTLVSLPTYLVFSLFPLHYELGLGSEWMEHRVYNFTYISWFWLVNILLSYPLSFITSYYIVYRFKNHHSNKCYSFCFSVERVKLLYLILALISIVALFANLSFASWNISLLFENSRLWESMFGKFWFINYAYFLHIPALLMFVLLKYKNSNSYYHNIIALTLIFGSMFHGIKYTFFDALFFPLLFYIVLVGLYKIKYLVTVCAVLFMLFVSFYTLSIRGIGEEADYFYFLKYMIPNVYNLFYSLELEPYPLGLPSQVIFSLGPDIIEQKGLIGGFILNDKYNMSTGYRFIISGLGVLGPLIVLSAFITTYNLLSNRTIFNIFIKSFILFSLLMMFYSYYVGTKPKYIFLIMVVYLVSFFVKLFNERKKTEEKHFG
ncbi:conserved membrane hypothetical protein [Vibrio chagasii]|nr:conserved membrane hypothetical protein [Vibrio chagasii]CAH7325137.1 conserved membrane hypothetical protein [Vibrio chagasii]CAH7363791.1 conserved membrane hypothetical protein [Vibrio chagasii]CAH7412086.1 conserved membrane hypothetical protein [Vibrio chagasii]CAH7476027.1 conserved membrane hypothetical protein [Vibrio chagasii]